MANAREDIRSIMNLVENISAPAILNEGVGTSLLAALGNKKAQGAKARQALANRFADAWKIWLGQTDREGSMEDMEQFLGSRAGFKPEQATEIIQRATQPIVQPGGEEADADAGDENQTATRESVELDEMDLMELSAGGLSRGEMKDIFNAAAAYAYDKNLLGRMSSGSTQGQGQSAPGSNPFVRYRNQQASQGDEEPVQRRTRTDKGKMWDIMQGEGVNAEDVSDLKHTVKSVRSFSSVASDAEIKMLALVGYAYLKASRS